MPQSDKATFRENDIRPSVHKKSIRDAFNADLLKLQSQKKEFVRVDCPACGSKKGDFAFEKYAFNFEVCQNCETVFMNPRATPQILNEFYAHSSLYDYWNRFIFPESEKIRREKIFKPRVTRILKICDQYKINAHCLVEVGAGFGMFCEEIKKEERFDHVIALEPVASLAKTCRSKGICTIEDTVENIASLKIPPDVLVSFEVIEHLFSPKSFLRNCHKLMASNSIVVVTCPNYKGFDISTLGPDSESIDAEHINLFNPESIKILFKRCGFSILECSTPGQLDVDIVRNQILAQNYDVSSQPLLHTILVDRWDEVGNKFQTFLSENNLSSHMWLVAIKRN
jgi:2-polyprenyl-3-methyl-5-hydroxy-6-metoxy-1,4-benzoquinol methylase/ribosomal protein S27E